MKLKFLILNFSFLILTACGVTKPVSMAHVERIEERVMPIPVGADTIEIELCRDTRLECPNEQNEKLSTFNFQPSTCIAFLSKNPTSTASPQCRDTRLECPDGTRSVNQRSLSLWRKNSVLSVSSVREKESSVRNTNSVRISSTRGINISRHETDTSTRIRLTLRPDTVFVPYTNHIRSDTIVVPDRVCQQKLNRSNMTNLFLILILIVIIIIFLKNRMTR